MKRIYLIIAIAFSGILMQAQVVLNEIELGARYVGGDEVQTTINGVSGYILIMKLNDSRVYQLSFFPTDNLRISNTDVEKIISWLEEEFMIKFEKPKKKKDMAFDFIASKDGVEFNILNFHSIVSSPPNRFNFFITNKKLHKIAAKENGW